MYSPLKKTKVILVISSHQSKPGYRMCYIWVAKLNIIYIMPKYLRKNMRFYIKKQTHNALFSSKQHVNWKQKAKNKCQFIINMQFYSLHIYARRIVAIFSSVCGQHALRTPMVL